MDMNPDNRLGIVPPSNYNLILLTNIPLGSFQSVL